MAYLEFLFKWGVYFCIVLVVGLPLNFLVVALTRSQRWWGGIGKALFIPGAVIHELGHAVACLVTGKRIVGTNFGTNPAKGGSVLFENTGICTPFALHAVAYAPVASCGIASALILNYISLNEANFELLDWIIWLFLLISITAGAAPSWPDAKLAFQSLRERPRVTLVEAVSLSWPIFLPELLGLASDMALLTYCVAVVVSYAILWKLIVSPHSHGIRKVTGWGLPGDGRDPRAIAWPTVQDIPKYPALPTTFSTARGIRVDVPIATVEDVYRSAGIKVKTKRSKHSRRVSVYA